MARRASSSVNPAWFAIAAFVVVAVIAGLWAMKGRFADPFSKLEAFPVADYLQNANSLHLNEYKLEGVVGEQLRYSKSARLFTIEVNGEPVSVVIPAELRDVNVQKGQRLRIRVKVGDKGVLKAIELKKV